MNIRLDTTAEQRAADALSLDAFGGLSLLHVKKQVAELLSHIGKYQIFDEYTKHDVSHLDSMLKICDWLIPHSTARQMTGADWAMIVLSVYLHDLGMLVTRDEYLARDSTSFPQYRTERLLTKDNAGRDYAGKLESLCQDDLDRFLYQEFVRAHHAERIRAWIDKPASRLLGASRAVAEEVQQLLLPLSPAVRADLGMICESHHLADLDDVNKYPVRQPYGNASGEIANVQYAAIILRTADVLQVTKERTPSIAYRILNPSDPISQEEWAKQSAVTAVVSQPAVDSDGAVDAQAPRDTIEYHAHFTSEAGFFGLTHYLAYAEQQLQQANKWADESRKKYGAGVYEFPWRRIDQAKIRTDGFLRKQFQFEIDQAKILDLLTGHTLYNDTNVVLRELTQNGIDAVRLQNSDTSGIRSGSQAGRVRIYWDSAERLLEVIDDGTGMTQEIIEQNFLKVGASRYQETAFIEQYPNFSPISRFGIGVLSAFMVADSVEVVTVHPDEDTARRISLRSVHGKYLIRLLDKELDEEVAKIGPHGTSVRLRIRASSTVADIVDLTRHWFVLPGCELTVTVDGKSQNVGYETPKQALSQTLKELPSVFNRPDQPARDIQVIEKTFSGVTVAYAVRWSPYFRQWNFISTPDPERLSPENRRLLNLGICVEGVRIRNSTPGFHRAAILAIANASGVNAPRTNVARSDLEDTDEYRSLLRAVYRILLAHVTEEIEGMHSERGYSPTRAIGESAYLLSPLMRTSELLASRTIFKEELSRIPTLIVENEGVREPLSIEQLKRHETLFGVEDDLVEKAESLLRQLPVAMSLDGLARSIKPMRIKLPHGPLLIFRQISDLTSELFDDEWEVSELVVETDPPRIEVSWKKQKTSRRWTKAYRGAGRRDRHDLDFDEFDDFDDMNLTFSSPNRITHAVRMALDNISTSGLDEYTGVVIRDDIYLLPNRSWMNAAIIAAGDISLQESSSAGVAVAGNAMFLAVHTEPAAIHTRSFEDNLQKRIHQLHPNHTYDAQRLLATLRECTWKIFDPRAWKRRDV